MHSRNNRAGILIGKGETPEQAVKEVGMVVEGMNALPAALELAAKYQVEMPIVQTVNAVVNKGMSAAEAVRSLMASVTPRTSCLRATKVIFFSSRGTTLSVIASQCHLSRGERFGAVLYGIKKAPPFGGSWQCRRL